MTKGCQVKDIYITMSEAAESMGVTRQTIARWINEGKFPAEKVGREVLIDKKELYQFEDSRIVEMIKKNIIRKIIQEWREDWQGYELEIELVEIRPKNIFVFSVCSEPFRKRWQEMTKKDFGETIEATYQIGKIEVDIEHNVIAVKIKDEHIEGMEYEEDKKYKGRWLD